MDDPYTIRGLLSRIRNEENRRVKEVAALNFQLQKQRKKGQKLEAETKLEKDKRRFKDNELIHVKMALGRRDDVVSQMERELDHCKEYHIHVDELEKAEKKESEVHGKLLEKESLLLTYQTKLENMKRSYTTMKRENTMLRAKYEQLLRSEHNASEEVELLRREIQMVKETQESERAMYENINSKDRDHTIQTLIALGRNLPDTFKNSTHAFNAVYSLSEEDDAISL